MAEATENLLKVASWLGTRCESTIGSTGDYENTWHSRSSSSILTGCEQDALVVTFPSFSLEHAKHLQKDDAQSKEKIQMQASSLLASRLAADIRDDTSLGDEKTPHVILSNLYSSFDKLVDARVLAFSKILGGHGLTLVKSQDDLSSAEDFSASSKVLEYKLKTLLEIGTSIYADSVSTTFLPTDEPKVVDNGDTTTIRMPSALKVDINNLHLPCSGSGQAAEFPVSFEAAGVIEGTFNQRNSNLLAIDVNVDCDALLQSMVQEASKVVAKVVELTNAAWTNASKTQATTEMDQCLQSINSNNVVPPEIHSNLPAKKPLPLIPLDLDNHIHHFDLVNGVILGNPMNDAESSDLDHPISAENASAIVDYVISEVDANAIAQPAFKKQRTLESS